MADAAPAAPNAPPAENLPEFKAPTVAAPPTIQGADAAYNEQAAKIEFQLNNALAGDKETFTNAANAYNTAIAGYNRTEPQAIGKQRFAAALGGWGNSGFQARDQGQIKAAYLEKRTGALSKFTETANKANRQAQEAYGARGLNLQAQGRAAEERYKRGLLKTNPQEQVTAIGGGPAGSSITQGPGSPQQPLKFGFNEAVAREQREAAARKARKR